MPGRPNTLDGTIRKIVYGGGPAVGAFWPSTATEQRLWTFGGSQPADVSGFRWVELYAGDATLAATPEEVAAAVCELLPA